MDESGEYHKLQFQELENIRNESYENAAIFKERTKAWHDKMLARETFIVGQKVFLYISRLRLFTGKLRSRWVGPFIATQVFQHGVVEIRSPSTEKIFKVNGHRLKPYYEGFQKEAVEGIDLIPFMKIDLLILMSSHDIK
ncbi:uncharacterized protein LOC141628962 [Silene latifolia]|uniref:uncharacterized protein LOC141628962 n=1 Tax=Silene latifolia TaxID=37657 RepID=UPI003D784C7B